MSESKTESNAKEIEGSSLQNELPSPRKSRWILKTFLSLIILLCGMVIGIMISVGFVRHKIRTFQFQPEVATQRVMSRFARHYDLTETQTAGLEKVVYEHFETLEKIGQEVHPRILAQMKTFGEKVADELGAEQRADWKKRFQFIRKNFLPQQPFRKAE